MISRARPIVLFLGSVLAVAACGGAPSEAPTGAAGGAAGGPSAGGRGGSAGSGVGGGAGRATGGSGAGAGASGAAGEAGKGGGAAGAGGASGPGGASGGGGASGVSGAADGGGGGASGQGGSAESGAGGAAGEGGAAGAAGATTGVPTLATGTITGATNAELTMIADGVALANTTMKTACFKNAVLSASWTENNGLTQAQIWDKLCSGTITVAVDMYLGTWYENNVSKTIGYENEPGTVHMNRYFVDTAYMVADNLIHEGEGHSQGFSHYGVKATSVPYGLNQAFETCSPIGP